MSDKIDDILPEFDENEEDIILKTQLKVYDVVMKYWQRMLMVLGVILLGVLIQGTYANHIQETQRAIHSEIALVKNNLPEPDRKYFYGLGPMDDPNDKAKIQKIEISAKELERIASESSGAGQWFAWMEAAALWERLNRNDERVVALQKAAELSVDTELKVTALMQLANAYQTANRSDDAIKTLDTVLTMKTSFEIPAKLNLARFYEDKGEPAKAKEILDTIAQAPMSLQRQIAEIQGRVISE